MGIWERQPDESEKAFAAFKIYLELKDRGCPQVAERLTVSKQSIHKWYSKFDWKNRAIAYDNSILEDKRRAYLQRYNEFLEKQFGGNEKIQERALKAFAEKDMSKISWKSLNEIYRSNCAEMVELAKVLGATADEKDSNIIINIRSKQPEGVTEDDDRQGY